MRHELLRNGLRSQFGDFFIFVIVGPQGAQPWCHTFVSQMASLGESEYTVSSAMLESG